MEKSASLSVVNVGGVSDIKNGDRPISKFKTRESKELMVAFAGPVGSGLSDVLDFCRQILEDAGYDVVHVKVSEFIERAIANEVVVLDRTYKDTEAGRIEKLQDGGNELRKLHECADLLAEYAIRKIAAYREEKTPSDSRDAFVTKRTAYLIDQLKNPAEVELFRAVYGNIFFLVGVLSTKGKREHRLKEKNISPEEISRLIERDRSEPNKYGQRLDKTLELADFFVRNDNHNIEAVKGALSRFVNLMHGGNGIAPTVHEYGMYLAFSAGLRSVCLSRQVGAAILDANGNVLATGRNDVPKFGGGLYGPEDGDNDARCVKYERRQCYNDFHKNLLKDEIKKILSEASVKIDCDDLIAKIYNSTRIKDLIEFSRAIHAEMDAIVSLARTSSMSTLGATLYVTTYPCHNCARHVVAAGISQVYFIEPYEKSLAVELHEDSISTDPVSGRGGERSKVEFIHFEGVAPRQYLELFKQHGERKVNGLAIFEKVRDASKSVPEYLDGYHDFELKVVQHLEGIENCKDMK